MEKNDQFKTEYYTVDLLHIAKTLLHRFWVIVLAGVLAAALGFSLAAFVIPPKYSASIMLYVNNSSFSLGNTSFSISSSEITAAQSLVKTYGEILDNRTTLNRVIEETGLPYTHKQLSKMISAYPSNDTEIMKVTVVAENPYHAEAIANGISEVLILRIAEIIDGASMEVVDSAEANPEKVAPSITQYTAIGLLLGMLCATLVLVVIAMMDDTVHDEEYVLRTYDYPILAKVPNLLGHGSKDYKYNYYSTKKRQKTQV